MTDRRADVHRGHERVMPPVLYVGTPVMLLSTANEDGSANLAPASSYWALEHMLVLGLETPGHTVANLQRQGEITVNFPSPDLWRQVEAIAEVTGADPVPQEKAPRYRHEPDKFRLSGLTSQPSQLVTPPRVAECLLQFEGVLRQLHDGVTRRYAIAEIEVVAVHAAPHLTVPGTHRIDPTVWEPLIYSFRGYFGLGTQHGARPTT